MYRPPGRVWLLWFDKSMQRKVTGRIGEFEHATAKAGRGWERYINLSSWFGRWAASHEFFEALLEHPQELRGLLPEAEAALIGVIRAELEVSASTDVVALDGCGSLFGVAKVSSLIGKVAAAVPGRLLGPSPASMQAACID